MNNSQVAHIWANNPSKTVKGSNVFTDEEGTIYSYGTHFPIARHYMGTILFTTKDYSVTTSKHKGTVRHACNHMQVFHVDSPRNNPSGSDVKAYAARIETITTQLSRARNPESILGQLQRETDEANSFCEKFGFKTRFSMPDDATLAKYLEKSKLAAQRKAKATKAKNERIERENAENIAKWLSGDGQSLSWSIQKVYLRANGDNLQTSKGATVTLTDAQRAFRFIMAHKESGWHRNGQTFAIGEFHLDAVNEFGIVAGCHRIAWDEIERFSKLQNWTA